MNDFSPRQKYYKALSPLGFHRVAYLEWGDPDSQKVIVCVHGLSMNSRSFDFLAQALQKNYRVICPDLVGRGLSDQTHNEMTYNLNQYTSDMTALIARLDVESVDWLGSSLGGLIGMIMASMPNSPIKRLILNDVGIRIAAAGVKRILDFSELSTSFKTLEEARENLKIRCSSFIASLTPEQFDHLAKYSIKMDANNLYTFHYDPLIFEGARKTTDKDADLSPLWKNIKAPTMLIHGMDSDLLLPETVAEMQKLRPDMALFEVPGVGHLPLLMSDEQIKAVKDWLEK